MKKKNIILTFFLLFLFTIKIFPQSGWIKIYACDYLGIGIHFFNSDLGYLINGNNLFRSTNGGNNWIGILTMNETYNGSSGFFFDINNYVLTGSSNNHIFGWVGIWKDGLRNDYWFNPTLGYLGIYSTDWINKDTGFVAGTDTDLSSYIGKAYRTTNKGLNWTDITPNGSLYINCIKFLNVNTGYILDPYLKKTTNMGNNWTLLIDSSSIADIHIVNSDTMYITCGTGRVNISTNGGLTWDSRNTGNNSGFNRIRFINSKTGWVAGNSGTIMRTTNAGVNWQLQTSNGPNFKLRDLFMLNENYIWASGDSAQTQGIVLRTSTGGVSFINKIGTESPNKFKLYQNHPNPFNPNTNIRYQNRDLRFVTLKVFDILGKEIATLVNEKQTPGVYEVTFNGSNFASGVYFYRIQAGDFVQVKKMLMIK